jgi:murein DD-endopeptidase MepM/ murein hydrolase activator NlpD
MIYTAEAKSLKQLRDELKRDEARQAQLIAEQRAKQKKIDAAESEIANLASEINSKENKVTESRKKIRQLESDIKEKRGEIDNLLSFLQISNGENLYLEYVFEAKTFSDFIYRSAVVEQLTQYNNDLINDMYEKIENNKVLQVQLKEEINSSEKAIESLEKVLKKYGLDMSDLASDQKDIKADIRARKVEIAEYERVYKENNCKEDQEITECVDVPPAGQFVRPLQKGTITSVYGMRYHPTRHVYTMHNGVDIGGNGTGTSVYAAAAGRVNKIVNRSSCGGNMVYIQHTVSGTKYRTVYMHLHTMNVKVGDIVTANTVIGTVGGGESYDRCSTGAHLHFGLLKGWEGSTYYNPANYVKLPGKGGRFTGRY